MPEPRLRRARGTLQPHHPPAAQSGAFDWRAPLLSVCVTLFAARSSAQDASRQPAKGTAPAPATQAPSVPAPERVAPKPDTFAHKPPAQPATPKQDELVLRQLELLMLLEMLKDYAMFEAEPKAAPKTSPKP
jgi:hypothetical protein